MKAKVKVKVEEKDKDKGKVMNNDTGKMQDTAGCQSKAMEDKIRQDEGTKHDLCYTLAEQRLRRDAKVQGLERSRQGREKGNTRPDKTTRSETDDKQGQRQTMSIDRQDNGEEDPQGV